MRKPVSYTHLDVYKRQPYMMGAVDAVLNDRVIEKSIKGTDVYKRQH